MSLHYIYLLTCDVLSTIYRLDMSLHSQFLLMCDLLSNNSVPITHFNSIVVNLLPTSGLFYT